MLCNITIPIWITDFKSKETEKENLSRDEKAGLIVFQTVYGGIQQGFSYQQIIRELSVLHYHGVNVGNLNHSVGTIFKIKNTTGSVLRKNVS